MIAARVYQYQCPLPLKKKRYAERVAQHRRPLNLLLPARCVCAHPLNGCKVDRRCPIVGTWCEDGCTTFSSRYFFECAEALITFVGVSCFFTCNVPAGEWLSPSRKSPQEFAVLNLRWLRQRHKALQSSILVSGSGLVNYVKIPPN